MLKVRKEKDRRFVSHYLMRSMAKKKIVVIDDDIGILDALQYTLEDAGYEVFVSEKGEFAQNLLKDASELPDLIILDVLLSGMDGRIICKNLKNNPITKHIPIIMISAQPGADKSTKLVGADGYLAKPFDVADLFDMVKQQLGE